MVFSCDLFFYYKFLAQFRILSVCLFAYFPTAFSPGVFEANFNLWSRRWISYSSLKGHFILQLGWIPACETAWWCFICYKWKLPICYCFLKPGVYYFESQPRNFLYTRVCLCPPCLSSLCPSQLELPLSHHLFQSDRIIGAGAECCTCRFPPDYLNTLLLRIIGSIILSRWVAPVSAAPNTPCVRSTSSMLWVFIPAWSLPYGLL